MQQDESGRPQPEKGPPRPPAAPEAEPMLYCPVCSSRLAGSRCKLVCGTCGYYMSCADYY
ncbi:MAG TPA: hypothetical protein ENJ62_03305 [Bryobacterales bacterium]|nr:hypothetical protein [Bryobacterales bacterium]